MRSTFKTQSEEKARPRVSTDLTGIEGNRRKSVPARLLLGLRRCSVLLLVIGLVMSLAVPYVALGRVISYETMEFNGKAMLGYSLGGIEVGAYGVDINEWGQVEEEDGEPNVVMSNYGYWNKERAQYAKELLQGSPEVNLLPDENRAGWDHIMRDYALPTPESEAALQTVDTSVAPMRRKADWEYWDSQPVGGSSPGMTVTIYPDFLILGWDGEHASVLRDPTDSSLWGDDEADSSGMHVRDTAAVPHYVPLNTLFEAFGLDKTVSDDEDNLITINTLIDAICADMRNGHSERLDEIVRNDTHSQDNDLLIGTHYENLNGVQGDDKQRDSASDAWNPYPYSMVFHQDLNPFGDAAGKEIVTSSIYNNTEAYAYLSPRSVYTQYMRLRSQYESLSALCHGDVCKDRPDFMLKLGYYLAGMSILEAYLNESLPQDMTRGYVGPTEGNPKVDGGDEALMDDKKLYPRSDKDGTVSQLFGTCLSQVGSERSLSERNQKPSPSNSDNTKEEPSQNHVGFQEVAYSQLMYDFADSASVKYGASGETTRLSDTNSIMNTLSTYGYGIIDEGELTNREDKSAGQGPNRGMSRLANMSRQTIFNPTAQDATTSVKDIDKTNDPLLNPLTDNDTNTGLYVPVYYPIQQHEMPTDPEMAYRLSILSFLPYETLMHELSQDNLTITPSGVGLSLAMRQGDIQHMKDVAQSMAANEMDADDVYDFVDIVRNVPHLRYETFMRHFNPLKGQVQSNDIFLTRISPAQTAYMPSLLTKGYESAGGLTNNEEIASTSIANFDYFSIPSLAPCLAAHENDDTYYGALSRELDVFPSHQFLSGLPANPNDGALNSFIASRDAIEDNLIDLADNEMAGLKRKIVTSYVLAKRLAFADAVSKITSASSVSDDGTIYDDGSVHLGHLWNSGLEDNVYPDWQETKDALKPTNNSEYDSPEDDEGSPTAPLGTRQANASSSNDDSSDDDLPSESELSGYKTTYEISNQEEANVLDPNGYLQVNRQAWEFARDTNDIDTTVEFFIPEDVQVIAKDIPEGKFDYVLRDFEPRHVLNEDALDEMSVWCKVPLPDGAAGYAFKTNLKTLFEALYREAFAKYLQLGGEYYWAGAKTISEWAESCDLEEFMTDEVTSCFTVADVFRTSDEYYRNRNERSAVHRDAAQQAIDRYFAYDFFDESGNLTDIDYNDRMLFRGVQLQNILAWGDFQSASESEETYLVDPSDANCGLPVIIGKAPLCTLPDGMIHNVQGLEELGMQVEENDGDWTIRVTQPQKMKEALSLQLHLQSHMVRGVSGTTYYATWQLAAYSMSATITRSHKLVSENTFLAEIPYANAYEEVIKQGTINYSFMQAHKLDVDALEAELEGDLRMRFAYGANWMTKIRRAFVLGRWHTLFEPEYYDIVE